MELMNDEKSINIYTRLHKDRVYLESLGYEVLGVFLQGSQNYHLDYEGSDIDTKAIVIPSLKDIVLNKKPVSTTLILDTSEHIDVKDIRIMFESFKKQNINFIEILFTEYSCLNPKYYDIWNAFIDNNEIIAHYNNYASVNCIVGMIMEKHKAMEHRYPTLVDKIDKYGYDPKQLHHIIRCREFLERYIAGEPYAECLIPKNPQYLIDVKSKAIYTLEEARELAERLENEAKAIKDDYIANNPVIINNYVSKLFEDTIYKCLLTHYKEEINGIQF